MNIFLSRRAMLMGSAAAAAGLVLMPGGARLMADDGAGRRYHALLVAVTAYPHLPPSNTLSGPNNDARLMRDYLLTGAPVPFAPEDVTVLADDFEGAAASPTLAAIRQAMADLASRAEAGDFVYLQFSGHGIQQPARDPEGEIDGMDEVFMPRDVRIMARGERAWPNGYVDKDIKQDLDRIRASGAFVWALFDCCHSGTITRDVAQAMRGEVERKVNLAEMDIPEDFWEGTRRSLGGTPRQTMLGEAARGDSAAEPADMGGLVAFYAAQTIEPTYELPLPPGAENPTHMGLFTYSVLTRLAENPAITYRQLGDAVMQSYTAMNRTRPIPMFEGDLDTAVFAAAGLQYVPEWPVQEGAGGRREIAAGHVHQLSPGTRLAIVPGPTATLDAALGLVEVGSVQAMRSTLTPVSVAEGEEAPDIPPIAPADIPPGAYARVVENVVPMELAVALPAPAGDHPDEALRVAAVLKTIAADARAPFRLRLVEAGAPADVRFDIRSRAGVAQMMRLQEEPENIDERLLAGAAQQSEPELWLLDSAAAISLRTGFAPPSRRLAGTGADDLEAWLRDTVTRVYRATNLARLPIGNDFGASDVSVELYFKRATPVDGQTEEVLQPSRVPFARPRDEVHLRVVNNSSRPVDVHALFIGADYAITPAANPERLQPGNRLDRGLFGISDSSFGRERVVVAMSQPEGMAPVLNLSFLGQSGVQSRGTGGSRGAAAGLRELLQDVADAPVTRSAVALGGGPQQSRDALMVYSMDVIPEG